MGAAGILSAMSRNAGALPSISNHAPWRFTMPDLSALKSELDAQVHKPATLSLEVVFDNKKGDVFDAIRASEEIISDARLAGATVRGVLCYGDKKYEVK
jgi:hypothetical protein